MHVYNGPGCGNTYDAKLQLIQLYKARLIKFYIVQQFDLDSMVHAPIKVYFETQHKFVI